MRTLLLALLASGSALAWADAASSELTVMTYNIRVGMGPATAEAERVPETLGAIADLMQAEGVDIALLQEVDRGTGRARGLDEPQFLAEATGMSAVFAPAIELGGGDFGVALLTNWEIAGHEVVPLFKPDYEQTHPDYPDYYSEQRVALVTELTSGERHLTAVVTHAGLTPDQRERQFEQIAELIEPHLAEGPVVFGGDLNCEPDAEELAPIRALLADSYHNLPNGTRPPRDIGFMDRLSFSSLEPHTCIDYIFHHGVGDLAETRVLDVSLSDHRPVVARFALPEAP